MQPYQAPLSGSLDSRSYQASSSRVSTGRPSQDKGKGKSKASAQAYVMHIVDHHDITIGTTVDGMLLFLVLGPMFCFIPMHHIPLYPCYF